MRTRMYLKLPTLRRHTLFRSLLLFLLATMISACTSDDGPIDDSDFLVSPSSLSFGPVELNEQKILTVEVTNNRSEQLAVAASLEGADTEVYAIVSQPDAALFPGQSGTVEVGFRPLAQRSYSARLTVGLDAAISVPLTGIGLDPDNVLSLNAVRVSSAPQIDGLADDNAWLASQELQTDLEQVEASSGDNRSFNLRIKSVHDGSSIYFLVRIDDESLHETPNQWTFLGGNAGDEQSWRRSEEGQDGLSLLFPLSNDVRGDAAGETFAALGCELACHQTSQAENYEGGMYPGGGIIDIWYWKAGTSNPQGLADDYFAVGSDGQIFTNERRGDVGKTFARENFSPDGAGLQLPARVAGTGNNGLNPSRFIWDQTDVNFNVDNNPATNAPWAANDLVPGWLLRVDDNQFASRADIRAKGVFTPGSGWTIELQRELNTGNTDDAVFAVGSTLPFSISYFDNVRKYATFEYSALASAPRPSHFGSTPRTISLTIE